MNNGYILTPDRTRLYYRKIGDSPNIVVIPNGIYLLEDFEPLARERTLIAWDPRNRGKSDRSPEGNINTDVEDIDAVRRLFGIEKVDLIGHSYVGLMVALYGLRHPEHVNRIVQIGAMGPVAGKQYAPPLSFDDGGVANVFARLGQLQKESAPGADPVESCRKFWSVLREIYVADPANAARIDWGRCELANERLFMHHWNSTLLPSIMKLRLEEEAPSLKTPVLTIHGRKDRSAAYGGGREWALLLPGARLVTVDEAAHAPWIEGAGESLRRDSDIPQRRLARGRRESYEP